MVLLMANGGSILQEKGYLRSYFNFEKVLSLILRRYLYLSKKLVISIYLSIYLLLLEFVTPSVPRKMAPSLGGMRFYATLFCVLSGGYKVRESE